MWRPGLYISLISFKIVYFVTEQPPAPTRCLRSCHFLFTYFWSLNFFTYTIYESHSPIINSWTQSQNLPPLINYASSKQILSPGLARLGIVYHIQSLPHPQQFPFAAMSLCILLTPTTPQQHDYNVIFFILCVVFVILHLL